MVFLLLAACSSSGGDELFFSSDGRYDQPGWGDADTGDTAGGDTGDDTGDNVGDDGAPVFGDVSGEWTDLVIGGNTIRALQVTAAYTDEGDDFDGGQCYIDAYVDDKKVGTFDGDVSSAGGDVCTLTATKMTFALQDLDNSKTTVVEFYVQDASNNQSALESVEVAGE